MYSHGFNSVTVALDPPTQLLVQLLLECIRKKIDKGNLVGVIFIDLSKAFDTIGHGNLPEKRKTYGIQGNELNRFSHYLFNRTQQVVIGNVKSEHCHVKCGVPQGQILGPLLFFLITLNQFEDILLRARTIHFADDTVIYFASDDYRITEGVLKQRI